MSSSITIPRAAGVGVTRPALSQLVASRTSHSRSILGWARSYHIGNKDKFERISRRIDKYHRHPEANCCRKAEAREDWPSTSHRIAGWTLGSWRRSRSSFSELSSGREKIFWDAENEQMARQMSSMKKLVSDDPYDALFGHRLGASRLGASYMEQNNARWPSFLWSFVNEKPAYAEPSKAHLQDFNFTRSPSSSSLGNPDALQYDPISTKASVDCPPGSEVEAKFASIPAVPEDSKFRKTSAIAHSQSIDCPPGTELDALYKTEPDALKEAKVTGVKHGEEFTQKPNINISCAPGSELEALFISESMHTEQPHAETFKVKKSAKHYNLDADFNTRGNVECAPGSELEAMFSSNPAARELEAKFATQLSLGEHYTAPTDVPNIDCTPGSEVEAKMVAESVIPFSQAPERSTASVDRTESVDCAPGSELEALFTADPASAETITRPTKLAHSGSTQKAPLTMDCAPGNELEAMFASEAAATGAYGKIEDVSPLQASDIRAGRISDVQYDGVEDRVGDFLALNPEAANTGSAPFRILAYDAAASKVASSEADSFFGANEPVESHEVLSRLHNPAKFVPYFEQMQQDGYEIATGGGDIIVFRKSSNGSINLIMSPEVAARQEAIHADIAKSIRHDSYDSSESSSRPSTSKLSSESKQNAKQHTRVEESQGSGSSTHPKPKIQSTFSKAVRRIFITGTAVGASCYAVGVVTEYFRTGGKDGYGIDGFTVFESDRRHR
ncbi:hypothetical protein N7481_013163 [Penicillium waksmanii]|uniref:uncharacterized protein n=1 Tax=Penicillium waksmanii TaxID=69791 RepID=UPI0025478075|nr:uncharacterized protein N7481_013163 [Penicillium waksmanii]KAJ5966449.1 hypothetical protein N7481_013163 [Penicillium waksmanii]